MNDLERAVRGRIHSYLTGSIDLRNLDAFLTPLELSFETLPAEVARLVGTCTLLIAEYTGAYVSLESLRSELDTLGHTYLATFRMPASAPTGPGFVSHSYSTGKATRAQLVA